MLTEQNIILENEHVLLRALQLDDIGNLKHFVETEPEIWKYSLMHIGSVEDLEKYITHAVESRSQKNAYPFIVFDKSKNKYAGSTRYYDIQMPYNSLQIGYTWYGKEFQGTLVNKNCKLLLLQYAFENLQMERVEFRADNRNQKSINAMQSIGCKVEGILRSHLPNAEGGRRDSIILSILKNEWQNGIKEMLIKKALVKDKRFI